MNKFITLALSAGLLVSCSDIKESEKTMTNTEKETTTEMKTDNRTETATTEETKKDLWEIPDVDVSHIDPNNRLICFTFDDGPKTETSFKLLKVFENFNKNNPSFEAHGTFFYVGNNINDMTKSIIEKAVEQKFQIGNHTLTHSHLENMTKEEILNEVNTPLNRLKEIIPIENALVRPPFGTTNSLVLDTIDAPLINWTTDPDLDALDWAGKTTDEIYNKIYKNAVDGGIILMHEGYETSVEAVKRLLPDLMEKGFQVVTIHEYLKVREIQLEKHKVYWSLFE